MKKNAIALLVVASLGMTLAMPASAQFGGLGAALGGSKSSSGDIAGQVKVFLDKSSVIQGLVYTSLKAIQSAYAKAEDVAKIAEEVKAFNALTDPKEKAAKTAEVLKSDAAKIEELTKGKNAQEQTKNLSKEKQNLLLKGITNFTIAGLQAADLGKSGSGIVQGVATNPMEIGKVAPVKEALPILSDAASVSTKVVPEFVKILKGANVQVPTVKADSKTEEITF